MENFKGKGGGSQVLQNFEGVGHKGGGLRNLDIFVFSGYGLGKKGVRSIFQGGADTLEDTMVNLFFCCHIILYWEKVTSYEKFNHNLTIEVQILWKDLAFQCYWWKYRNTEK